MLVYAFMCILLWIISLYGCLFASGKRETIQDALNDMPSPTLSHKLRYSEIRWLLEIENDISILYSEIEDKEAKFD